MVNTTPVHTTLELRRRVKEIKKRKVIVGITLSADDEIRATGEVVMIQVA